MCTRRQSNQLFKGDFVQCVNYVTPGTAVWLGFCNVYLNNLNKIFMKTLTSTFKKIGFTALFVAGMYGSSHATTFTAIASGNFTSALTWGGLVPGSLISTDVIIIPAGINVNLDADAVFSGTSSLFVDGSLVSGSSATALVLSAGALAGSGNIDVDSLAIGLTTGLSFTGNVVARNATSLGTTISSMATMKVKNTLRLASGAMSFTAGSLTMFNNSTIVLSGGTMASSGTGVIGLDSMYSVVYTSASATSGMELSGSGLRNVTLNLSGTITLSSDLVVDNGDLSLSSGILALNSHKLTIGSGGNLITTGSGSLSGNTTSDLTIMSSGSLTGALTFSGSGNTLRNLTINTGSSSANVTLGNSLTLAGTLDLLSGRVVLGANDLTVNAGGMVTSGSANSYVIADGAGRLTLNLAAGATDKFDVGTTSHYAPVSIKANTGSATGNVSVNVAGSVYGSGTTGTVLSTTKAVVSNTWYVSSSATAAINYDMTVMWDAAMEVNGFNRTQAYISHYTSSAWDAQTPVAASTSGSMYTMTRTGITSLSPFMVADNTFSTTGILTTVAGGTEVIIYPNPASGSLHFNSVTPVTSLSVYNMMGQTVLTGNVYNNSYSVDALPKGQYTIRLVGSNFNVVKTFLKD